MNRQRISLKGEDLARRFLLKKGYRILFHRFWTRFGEIDLVAQKKDCISFIEVKTLNNTCEEPLANITPKKINRLFRASQILLKNWRGAPPNYQIEFLGIGVWLGDKKARIEWVNLFPD